MPNFPEGHEPDGKSIKARPLQVPSLEVDEKGIVQLVSLKEYAGDLKGSREIPSTKERHHFQQKRRHNDHRTGNLHPFRRVDTAPSGTYIVFRVAGEYDPVKVFNILRSDYGQFLIREATKHLFMEFLPLHAIQAMRLPVEAIKADRPEQSGSQDKRISTDEGSDSDV